MIVKECLKVHLDSKGRLLLSKKEYSELGEKIVITKNNDRYVYILFSEEEWTQLVAEKLKDLKLKGFKGKELRWITRILYSSAFSERVDRWRRVRISTMMRKEVRRDARDAGIYQIYEEK